MRALDAPIERRGGGPPSSRLGVLFEFVKRVWILFIFKGGGGFGSRSARSSTMANVTCGPKRGGPPFSLSRLKKKKKTQNSSLKALGKWVEGVFARNAHAREIDD